MRVIVTFDIGGQAVIEGVMMRAGQVWTVAVRTPEKDIVVKKEDIAELPKILKKRGNGLASCSRTRTINFSVQLYWKMWLLVR